MPPFIAEKAEIYVDGYNLACAFQEMTMKKKAGEVDVTALCTPGNRKFLPGLKDGMLSFTGFYDYDADLLNQIENILNAAFDAQQDIIVSASLTELVVGETAFMVRGGQNEKGVESVNGQAINTNGSIRAKGNIYHGTWLYKGSADDDSDVGDSVDNGAASSNGGVLHFHQYLEDDSDATDGEILVEHSTDNSTWVTLIATQTLGAENGALIVEVAPGTTVRRYLRPTYTAVGGKGYGVADFYRF